VTHWAKIATAAVASVVLPHCTRARPGRIVLTSFHGRGYRGNPRVLFERLVELERFDPVWLSTDARIVDRVRRQFGPRRAHLTHSTSGVFALATARAVILSHGITDFPWLRLPRRAERVQSWHGLPTKRGELMPQPGRRVTAWTRLQIRRRFGPFTAFVSSSPLVTSIYAERFGLPPQVFIESGYPAYDSLCTSSPTGLDTRALWPDAPDHEHLVLYAPTFRKREPTRLFPFPDADLATFAGFLDETRALCCLRPHPNERIDLAPYLASSPRFVVADDRRLEDIQALTAAASAIVTDYSGVFIEGLLADVPCVFVPYDLPRYERGIPWDYPTYTPGPSVDTQAGLIDALHDAFETPETNRAERARVRDVFFSTRDGRATDRLVQWLSTRLA
jgi:CDP-glycerol glycerophosphotransferase (TagB/SpsB family)